MLLPFLILIGCGRSAEREAGAPADSAAPSAPDTTSATAPPVTPVQVLAARPIRFAHNPHGQVDCRTCHTAIPGHARHASVACAECHELPSQAGSARVAAGECNACHHGPDQARACLDCHGSAPAGVREVRAVIRVSVRPSAQERALGFEHARHERVACRECHTHLPDGAAPEPCSTCHAQHHRAQANCLGCHPAPGRGGHDRSVHRGCGGTGCHSDAAVTALPLTRPVCLVCHRAQENHEPGEDCRRCHLSGSATISGEVRFP
jgi:hypothetical protein